MPPKRRHDSESSSGAAAVKRIRIVAKNEQFICTDCGASLESVKQLNSHMRRHKTFLCDKCNKSISLNNKQRHQKLCGNRNQEVTMHSCAECYDKVKFASGYILSLSLSFAFGICILKADISFLCVVIDLPL